MRTGGVLNILGKLLLLLSLFLLTPIPFSYYYQDGMVVFSWLGLAFLGALPFYFSGAMDSFVDCLFESMSGFTTTGSTILTKVEILPESVLFWRALTHWLGGMGIIVLTLAILPLLGIGGMQLFQAEMPGPTKDRLAPRIQDTARILWSVYVLFTLVEIFLLLLGKVNFFDAVVIVFMFMAGTNFSLHYQGLRGRLSAYWKNEEFRFYLFLTLVSVCFIIFVNLIYKTYENFGQTLRTAFFQVTSILTTTGFGTADFDQWPPACKILLVSLMFVGGCAGSTGGGIKHVRLLLFFKYARLQLRNLVHPQAVGTIKLGKVKVPREILISILGFFALYIAFFFLATLVVTALGVDIVTGSTAVVATLNNIGPGLNLVGPVQHYGHLPPLAKVVLTICMLAGRLELYTVAVLLTPDFWAMARKPLLRWKLPGTSLS
jgi:trk system potassium uptake protein TrkH